MMNNDLTGQLRSAHHPTVDTLRIRGGSRLAGNATVHGAKNSALPIMAASLLADGPVNLERVPRLLDVASMCRVLVQLGVDVRRLTGSRLRLETIDQKPTHPSEKLVRRMRASFCVLGPLLARRGKAIVSLPGGCLLGDRPIDLHLHGLAQLGAEFKIQRGHVVGKAKQLRGATIRLAGPHGSTVTGTANVLGAAVLARGKTVIQQAAQEPEIVDLCRFLIALGANIQGVGTSTLEIQGVDQLGNCTHQLISDRIEAATLLIATTITGGRVTLEQTNSLHLAPVLELLKQAGAEVWIKGHHVTLQRTRSLKPLQVTAEPFPGVPTDIQPMLAVLCCLAQGRSSITDTVFPSRVSHLAELRRLGASVWEHQNQIQVRGVLRLAGAEVVAADLRSAAALVLAGLVADGETVVRKVKHLDRGYERLDEQLRQLGAMISRQSKPIHRAQTAELNDVISA